MTVDADIPASTDLLGKSVTDLQENVTVSNGVVSGNLKFVSGYTGFSGDVEKQSGNYLAIHAEQDGSTSISARFIGDTDAVTLDSDGLLILRMRDGATGFELITVADGVTYVNRFMFNLTLESED